MIDAASRTRVFLPALRPVVLLGVLLAVGVGVYVAFKPEPAPTGVHLPAKPAPQVAREIKTEIALKSPVKVYRPEVKRKLKLPDAIQQNADQHVIASSRTVADERPHTITTVIDASTGEATTFDRTEPLPWLGVSTKTEIGAFYGVKNGVPTWRVQAQQELLQVKAVRIGATATLDSDGETFVGVGAWARW